jgi:flavin reductase (DIM6/NTAB) family NADH-FMN oxidoreductase RutF
MDFDFGVLPAPLRYKLLTALVVPRPIALVSTISPAGVVNAAPFSFFNLLGDDPPILIVSIEARPDGRLKDSARNLLDSGEFVVNLVDEATVERMHACSTDFPPEVSEVEAVGFATAPSQAIAPPWISDCPASLECRLLQRIEISEGRLLAIGEVVWLHCQDGLIDPATLRVDPSRYRPVGRLFADQYVRTGDRFSVTNSPEYLEAIRRRGRL